MLVHYCSTVHARERGEDLDHSLDSGAEPDMHHGVVKDLDYEAVAGRVCGVVEGQAPYPLLFIEIKLKVDTTASVPSLQCEDAFLC